MVATLYSGLSTARIGSLSFVYDDIFISPTTAAVADGRYCHVNISSVMSTGLYTALALAVQEAGNVASPSGDFAVSFSTTTRRYTISNAASPFVMDMTSTAGQRLAKALGFTASNPLGSGSGYACTITSVDTDAVSDVLPYYLVPLARDEPAKFAPEYEPSGMVKRARTTNANAVSVEPISIEELIDLQCWFMPIANVQARSATAAQPWTIQHCIRHARAHEPLLFDFVATGDFVVKLTEGSACFTKEAREVAFAQGDYQGLWHYKFDALQLLGTL